MWGIFMKLTAKEMINQLKQYPDDYELNLSHYFLVKVSEETGGRNKGKEKFMHSMINIPIVGTAADKNSKEIRLVLRSSNKEVLDRIEAGAVHPIPSKDDCEDIGEDTICDSGKISAV